MAQFNANASFNAGGIGFSIGLGTAAGPIPGQTFRTVPVPNFQTCLYALAIRGPTPPYPLVSMYTFPLSPEQVRKEYASMTNIFDVAGSPAQAGVARQADLYGDSPVTFMIDGTTGWQYHSTDGYRMTGLQSIIALQNFLNYFAQLNQSQMRNRIANLYMLEFYDYFSGDFWQVVPVGRQSINRSVRRPLLAQYSFRLAGLQSLAAPRVPTTADPIALAFSVGVTQGSINLRANLAGFISGYAAVS